MVMYESMPAIPNSYGYTATGVPYTVVHAAPPPYYEYEPQPYSLPVEYAAGGYHDKHIKDGFAVTYTPPEPRFSISVSQSTPRTMPPFSVRTEQHFIPSSAVLRHCPPRETHYYYDKPRRSHVIEPVPQEIRYHSTKKVPVREGVQYVHLVVDPPKKSLKDGLRRSNSGKRQHGSSEFKIELQKKHVLGITLPSRRSKDKEPVKEERVREKRVKEERVKEERVKRERVKEEPVKRERVKEEPVKRERVKEARKKEEPIREQKGSAFSRYKENQIKPILRRMSNAARRSEPVTSTELVNRRLSVESRSSTTPVKRVRFAD
ncbi:hypothetical protein RUND412_008016 [Rhizina undulata]